MQKSVVEKITFIINPSAGNGHVKKKWPEIETKAKERFKSVKAYLTKGPGNASILTQKAIYSGSDLIVSVGGDGTLNEVINGVVGLDALNHKEVTLGVLPFGTGCDVVKSLLIPKSVDKFFELVVSRQTRRIDLGKIEFPNHSNPSIQTTTRFFP